MLAYNCGQLVDTLSLAGVGDQPSPGNCRKVAVRRPDREVQQTKKSGNELKQVLENKGRVLKNELKTNSKRTQNELILMPKTRLWWAIEPDFEEP